MFPNIQRYMAAKYGPKKPVEEVTEEEFVAAVIATGETEEKAKQIAFFSKEMGASTEIGGRMLQIKQPPKPKNLFTACVTRLRRWITLTIYPG